MNIRARKEIATSLAVTLCGMALVYTALTRPSKYLLGAFVVVSIPFVARRPRVTVPLAVIAAFATMPVGVPVVWYPSSASVGIPIYEPLLLAAAVYARVSSRPTPKVGRRAVVFSMAIILSGLLGWTMGNDMERTVLEAKLLLDMVLAFYVAAAFMETPIAKTTSRVVAGVLWWSAGLVVVGSLTGLELQGRAETAHLAGASSQAVRFLTSAQFLALATFLLTLTMFFAGRLTFKRSLPWLLPSALLLLLAFSRNTLLGLGVCLLFAFLASRSTRSAIRLGTRALMTVGITVVLFVALLQSFPSSNPAIWADHQFSAYQMRVFGGLGSQAISADPSVRTRLDEADHLSSAISSSPVVGHGLGYMYQPRRGAVDSFEGNLEPFYAHNFYMWWLAKAGILGMLAFLYFAVTPLFTVLRNAGRAHAVALGGTSAALLAVSFVAPLPEDSPTSVCLGAVLGLLATSAFRERRDGPANTNIDVRDYADA